MQTLLLHPEPPQTPAGIDGTSTVTTVNLTWPETEGASSYNIYRNGTKVGSTDSGSYKDTGLVASTEYIYTIEAVNNELVSEQSSEFTIVTAESTGSA
ncbi:fibronectin type III domain-containing protein [Listeria seeligeri]|uniref:fibronectin type III domain-containing protein n=1 Tax=Listeria seeligeri TaxID=1640 RepID=UPI0022EBF35E|nr:fibronectin type III domain-containing protein [Listeria seeligeri]